MLRAFAGRWPTIPESSYVDVSAQLLGDVTIGEQSSVWMGAVLRGDVHTIRIGARSNVQDNVVLHGQRGLWPVVVGDGCTIGHGAVVHGCVLDDDVLVGMGAVILNGARVGAGSIIAAGAVVTEGAQIPAGSLVTGVPGRVRRELNSTDLDLIRGYAQNYVEYTAIYLAEARGTGWGVGARCRWDSAVRGMSGIHSFTMPRTIWVGLACAAVLGMSALAQAPHSRVTEAKASLGQAAGAKAQVEKDPYAGEPLVIERLDTVYRYNADGTGTQVETRVLRVQNEAGRRAALVLSVLYPTESRQVEVLSLRVRKPNGTVVDTPPSDAGDGPAPVAQIAPVYGDVHVMQIGARGLAVGDRLESEVRTTFTKPEADGQFWGSERMRDGKAVVLERRVELHVPSGRNVLVSSPKLPPVMSEEGGEKVFKWTGSQRKPSSKAAGPIVGQATGDEGEAEGDSDGADAERTPSVVWTTFGNWAQVGAWYRGLVGSGAATTPSLKARADQLVYGLKTPEERVRALYAYVAGEVRSIDVPWGPGRYAPHPAEEVLENLYGNSNDKSAVLVALLRAEGIAASTALVGPTEVDEAVPSPGWFDHAVTVANVGQQGVIWLDPSAEYAPFRMLRSPLRDRTALVVASEGQSAPQRTPADLPFAAFNRFEAKGTLSRAGALQAHVDVAMRGDEELRYRTGFRMVGPTRWDQVSAFFVRANVLAGSPSNTVAENVENAAEPLKFGFELGQSPYGDWQNYRIAPLEPGLNLPLTDRKSAPDQDVELGGKRTDSAVSRITLPPGFGADLPDAQHLQADFATLSREYRLEMAGNDRVLVTERTLVIKAARVPVPRNGQLTGSFWMT